jgi:hypothetical protein
MVGKGWRWQNHLDLLASLFVLLRRRRPPLNFIVLARFFEKCPPLNFIVLARFFEKCPPLNFIVLARFFEKCPPRLNL